MTKFELKCANFNHFLTFSVEKGYNLLLHITYTPFANVLSHFCLFDHILSTTAYFPTERKIRFKKLLGHKQANLARIFIFDFQVPPPPLKCISGILVQTPAPLKFQSYKKESLVIAYIVIILGFNTSFDI